MKKSYKLIISLLAPLAAGAIGSVFTVSTIPGWYATLVRPGFTPPNWLFGPAWTLLYILMGSALFFVWKATADKTAKTRAIGIFVFQLILNTLWSFIFFGLHKIGLALIEIAILWLAILATILAFSKISRTAAWLLAPYILWVSFAGYLNCSLFLLNR